MVPRGDIVNGDGSSSAAKEVAPVTGGALLLPGGLLHLKGPGLPCWPCFGGRSKAVPVKVELGKAACQE